MYVHAAHKENINATSYTNIREGCQRSIALASFTLFTSAGVAAFELADCGPLGLH